MAIETRTGGHAAAPSRPGQSGVASQMPRLHVRWCGSCGWPRPGRHVHCYVCGERLRECSDYVHQVVYPFCQVCGVRVEGVYLCGSLCGRIAEKERQRETHGWIGVRGSDAKVARGWDGAAWCPACHSPKPLSHLYCYVCGGEVVEIETLGEISSRDEESVVLECRRCGGGFRAAGRQYRYCGTCRKLAYDERARRAQRRRYYVLRGREVPPPLEALTERECPVCEEMFLPVYPQQVTCGKACAAERHRRQNLVVAHRFYREHREEILATQRASRASRRQSREVDSRGDLDLSAAGAGVMDVP